MHIRKYQTRIDLDKINLHKLINKAQRVIAQFYLNIKEQ